MSAAYEWRATGQDAQRVTLAGKTGSGKTTLAAVLASNAWPCVYFDPKGLNDPHWSRVMTTRQAVAYIESGQLQDTDQILVQQDLDREFPAEDQLDELARVTFARGNVALVADDGSGILETKPSYWLKQVITMGRGRGVGFMAIVQRVHNVPRLFITEPEHLIAFELHGAEDVERLARDGDPSLNAAANLARWAFFWYDRENRQGAQFRPLPFASKPLERVEGVPA